MARRKPIKQRGISSRTKHRAASRKKYARSKRASVVSNKRLASSAMALAKRNSLLARGALQMNLQHTKGYLKFSMTMPLCFCLEDISAKWDPESTQPFNEGCPIFQFTGYGFGGILNPGTHDQLTAVSHFQHPNANAIAGWMNLAPGSDTFNTGQFSQRMWDEPNGDVLNGKFMITNQKYETHVGIANPVPAQTLPVNCRIKISFWQSKQRRTISVNDVPTHGLMDNRSFPGCLGQFCYEPSMFSTPNPMYYKEVRKSLEFSFKGGGAPYDNDLSPQQNPIRHFSAGKKLLNPKPYAANYVPPRAGLHNNIPKNKQTWVIIQTDAQGATQNDLSAGNLPKIALKRLIRWRDNAGHAA